MGKLVYLMNVSLDGYVETADHSLDWSTVTDESHRWFAEGMREMDALLYGSRIYRLMNDYWPKADQDPSATEGVLEFARVWNATPKIVFSSSLTEVGANARLVRPADVGEELARLRTEFDGVLSVAGPTLAAQFVARNLVDEYQLVVHPVVLGSGTPFIPRLDAPIHLEHRETQSLGSGVLYLRYERV